MNLKKRKVGSKILLGALIAGVVGLCTEQLIVGKPIKVEPVQAQQTQKAEPVQAQQTQKAEPVQAQQTQKAEPVQAQQTQKAEPVQAQQTQKAEPAQAQQTQKAEPAQAQQTQKTEPQIQKEKPVQPQTQKQRQAKIPEERQGKLGPQCQVGDSWTVETSTAQITTASELKVERINVQWQFTVESIEQIAERDCYRIHVKCLEPGRAQPDVTLWVDDSSGMLTRVTSRMMVRGEWTEFTETYVSDDGSAVPVLGVIPALPFDMPVFESEKNADEITVKSLDAKSYEILSGDVTEKGLDSLSFAREVNQTVTKPEEVFVKSLDDTLPQDETVQVEIDGGRQKVKQVWAPGNPWPVYSDNGVTEARLLDFVPAGETQE